MIAICIAKMAQNAGKGRGSDRACGGRVGTNRGTADAAATANAPERIKADFRSSATRVWQNPKLEIRKKTRNSKLETRRKNSRLLFKRRPFELFGLMTKAFSDFGFRVSDFYLNS